MAFVMSDCSIGSCDVCTKIDGYSNTDGAVGESNPIDENSSIEIILRRLLPRLMAKSDRLVELVLVDKIKKEVLFMPVCTEKPEKEAFNDGQQNNHTEVMPYKISYLQYSDTDISITLHISENALARFPSDNKGGDGIVCPSIKWLRDQLLPKLNKWAENPENKSKGSLRLISLERYTILYQTLKEKYGWDLVKKWPENTDPQKFVFEDIAIATYLIILWEVERERMNLKEKQSFVDLGCGNGLLYPGSGIDVRRRRIWDLYGPEVPLEYVRKNNKLSQYHGYLEFVNHVGISCGFQVEEDMLRIPSTKRICQIGQSRTYPEEHKDIMETKIKNLIRERGCDIDSGQQPQTFQISTKSTNDVPTRETHDTLSESEKSIETKVKCSNDSEDIDGGPPCKKPVLVSEHSSHNAFQPREQRIEVKNCSQLSKSLKEFIVGTILQALLKKDHNNSCCEGEHKLTSTGKPLRIWRKGGSIALSEAAKLFDKDTLKKLKNECGGIQTLLRNHRFIFKVVGGIVELQDWRDQLPGPKLTTGDHEYLKRRYDALRNTSLCWFHFNHPDGCVLQTDQCPYAHNESDLINRPSQEYLKNL
ncbi:putative tRNA (uracil-O(2)-)-methyltransferase [Exaiptasia diaphana]|nr:putative tRNA (uracil-O(2)-)-methyltransferase [Exaiptasia diaphana]